MNKPWMKHKFSKESEDALIKFLKTAQAQKSNSFCDSNKYEIWKNYVGEVDDDIGRKLEQKSELIDLTENEKVLDCCVENESVNKTIEELQTTTCEDITASIKEHLESADQLPDQLLKEMQKFSQEAIREIFNGLSEKLNTQQILLIGESIEQYFENDLIMRYFCKCVLLKKMMTSFEEDIKLLFLRFCDGFYQIVMPQIVDSINEADHVDILLLYLTATKPYQQEELLRELLKDLEYFPKKLILTLDCLLHENIGFDCLKQSVEIMANNTEQYLGDKEYGKLLIKLTQLLGTNLVRLENPFRHILSNHNSIWKTKLQKIFNNCFGKSMLSFASQGID